MMFLLISFWDRLFVERFSFYIVLFFLSWNKRKWYLSREEPKKEKVAAFEDQAIVPGQDLEKNASFQSKNATIEVIYSIYIA